MTPILQQLDALANQPEHLPKVTLTTAFLASVRDHVARLERQLREGSQIQVRGVCPSCESHETFDIAGHLSAPSRLKPFAAAAAVQMRKEERAL